MQGGATSCADGTYLYIINGSASCQNCPPELKKCKFDYLNVKIIPFDSTTANSCNTGFTYDASSNYCTSTLKSKCATNEYLDSTLTC